MAPNAIRILAVSGFLGLVLGTSLAYVADLTDQSFRTPAEIRARLGLPILGDIPHFVPATDSDREALANPSLDPGLCCYYHPWSFETEAYRGLRTALFFASQRQGHKVFQITSPNPGDGKSTAAAKPHYNNQTGR